MDELNAREVAQRLPGLLRSPFVAVPVGTALGAWCSCSDKRAHYFLGGKALCGTRLPSEGETAHSERYGKHQSTGALVLPRCEACRAANMDRWESLGK